MTNLRTVPIYTFRAHGQMYHNVKGFGHQDGVQPSHVELYFYENNPQLLTRMRLVRPKHVENDREVIHILVNCLNGNPYSCSLQMMGEIESVDEYCISLDLDPRVDQHTYNLLLASEVAAVWVEGGERIEKLARGVV